MKQIKVSTPCGCGEEEYHDYSWLTMKPHKSPEVIAIRKDGETYPPNILTEEPEYQTSENYPKDLDLDAQVKVLTLQLKDLRNQIKGLRRELKSHIDNCPFREIKG